MAFRSLPLITSFFLGYRHSVVLLNYHVLSRHVRGCFLQMAADALPSPMLCISSNMPVGMTINHDVSTHRSYSNTCGNILVLGINTNTTNCLATSTRSPLMSSKAPPCLAPSQLLPHPSVKMGRYYRTRSAPTLRQHKTRSQGSLRLGD